MQFGFLGVNYKNALLEIRDKISFTEGKKLEFFQRAEAVGVEQCMVLSTCNRSEVYYIYEKEEQERQIWEIYREMFSDVDLSGCLVQLSGEDAVAYLFRIAAGLESRVLWGDKNN